MMQITHQREFAELVRSYVYTLNQLHEMKKKLRVTADASNVNRNIARIEEHLASNLSLPIRLDGALGAAGLYVEDPINEPYDGRRADIDAELLAPLSDRLVITEVLRPVIKLKVFGQSITVQRGSVLVDEPKQA